MNGIKEIIEVVSTRHNPEIDPILSVWRWEIPVYLFLGGLVAGLLILSGLFYLLRKDKEMPFTVFRASMWAAPLLGLGMFALFLDLSHKLYVWRFYTAFKWTSPMSWGAWVLLVVFPVSIVFGLQQLRQADRDWLKNKFAKLPVVPGLLDKLIEISDKLEPYKKALAVTNIVVGIFLGIYTGILLSAFVARPFWNSSILGFLFLASGLSAASAFGIIFAENETETKTLVKIDVSFLVLELVILLMIIIGFFGSSQAAKQAGRLIFGGPFTAGFWSLVVFLGMIVPIILESLELKGKLHLKYATPILVLIGGLFLRIFMVYMGQFSKFPMIH